MPGGRPQDDVDRTRRLGRPGRQLELTAEAVRAGMPQDELLHRQVGSVDDLELRIPTQARCHRNSECETDAFERLQVQWPHAALEPAHDHPADTGATAELTLRPAPTLPDCLRVAADTGKPLAQPSLRVGSKGEAPSWWHRFLRRVASDCLGAGVIAT